MSYRVDTTARTGISYTYRLTAVDYTGLTNVESATVTLALLDEGLAPSLKNVRLTGDSTRRTISLRWQYAQPGVDRFLLYRRKGAGYLSEYKYVPANMTTFVEQQVVYETPYEYAVMALMSDGRRSRLSPRQTITLLPPKPSSNPTPTVPPTKP